MMWLFKFSGRSVQEQQCDECRFAEACRLVKSCITIPEYVNSTHMFA